MKNGKRIIVSMTSWVKRIDNVATVLKSILQQTLKPDLIELNLSIIEFPKKNCDLPTDLIELISNNKEIEINWLEKNDYSFKKIIPTIQKFFGENYYLVSIDDDYIYWNEFIEKSIWELESNDVDAFNFSTTPIWGNKQIYKSTCFKPDFWEDLTQEVIDTKHDDLYIYPYLIKNNKKVYYYKPKNFYEIFEPFNQENSISKNGFYSFQELYNAKKLINNILINKEKMRNLKKFETNQEQQYYQFKDDCVSYIVETDRVSINKIDYSKIYLTYIPLGNCKMKFISNTNDSIQYSVNEGKSWQTLENESYTSEIAANTRILIKGNCQSDGSGEYDDGIGHICVYTNDTDYIKVPYNVEGNIMSILYGDNFENQFTITLQKSLIRFFNNETSVVDAFNLILPATTLADSCYCGMFNGCTSLTKAPELPATTLANSCYNQMFSGCTSLTTAPQLPATTLAQSCYYGMFNGCTSLTTAPQLQATTLATQCYYDMFNGCTNLNYIKMLATDISARNCLIDWVSGVAASGTFVKAASMTTLPSGVNGIPNGWTVQDAIG